MVSDALTGALATAILALLTYIGLAITRRVKDLEIRLGAHEVRMEARHVENAERLVKIETLLRLDDGRRTYQGRDGC